MKPTVNSKPHIIITVGIPGSGKSYFAEHFAEMFKSPIVSIDNIREKIFQEPSYTKDEEEIVNQLAMYMLDEILKSCRTVVYDGSTGLRYERDLIARMARNAGYEPLFVWIQTELPTAKSRTLKQKTTKSARMSEERFDYKVNRFTNPNISEKFVVVSGMHAKSTQLRIVLKRLVESNPVIDKQPAAQSAQPRNRSYLIR